MKRGRYSSASEVVSVAWQLLLEQEMERTMRLEELRKEIAVGIADSDRGDVFDGEEVIRELRDEIRQAQMEEWGRLLLERRYSSSASKSIDRQKAI